MIKEAIEKIITLAEPNIKKIEGHTYSDKKMIHITQPQIASMILHTLTGMIKIVESELTDFANQLIVHAAEHNEVIITTRINSDREREIPYIVTAQTPNIIFNRFLPLEEMVIQLRSKFVRTEALDKIIELLGNIKEEDAVQIADDGITQVATVKSGVTLVKNQLVNPIVGLSPYRTFAEVEQPESAFLLRLKKGGEAALFEADGAAWKIQARKNIAEFLKNEFDALKISDKVLTIE